MPTVADYVMHAKAKLGDPYMSDRVLGEHFGLASSTISNARYGRMSDETAIKVAHVLGLEAGEVIMVARIERETDPIIKRALSSYARRVLSTAEERWRRLSVPHRLRTKALS